MLSGKILPIHPKPLEDELLSSWIVRLIKGNYMGYRTFFSKEMPRQTDRNKDIDRSADEEALVLLATKTGTSPERLFKTILRAYEGFIYENHSDQGNINWIMPIGIHGSSKMRFGLQCCPECLAEDAEPYYRRAWRLAFVTCCVKHGRMLIDRCPVCGDCTNSRNIPVEKESITLCKKCDYDLRLASTSMASRRLLETQSKLLEAVDNGWIMVDGHGPIYSHLFFQVLHQLSRLLCIGKHVHILKECVQQESGICGLFDIHLPTNCHLESLGVQDRAVLTEAAYWLLDGYPDRLVNIFRLCGIGKTELTYHLPQIPFWFNCALDQLDRSYYTISTDEVSNAVSFMGRNDSRISNVGLNRVLGRGKRTKTIMKLVGS